MGGSAAQSSPVFLSPEGSVTTGLSVPPKGLITGAESPVSGWHERAEALASSAELDGGVAAAEGRVCDRHRNAREGERHSEQSVLREHLTVVEPDRRQVEPSPAMCRNNLSGEPRRQRLLRDACSSLPVEVPQSDEVGRGRREGDRMWRPVEPESGTRSVPPLMSRRTERAAGPHQDPRQVNPRETLPYAPKMRPYPGDECVIGAVRTGTGSVVPGASSSVGVVDTSSEQRLPPGTRRRRRDQPTRQKHGDHDR